MSRAIFTTALHVLAEFPQDEIRACIHALSYKDLARCLVFAVSSINYQLATTYYVFQTTLRAIVAEVARESLLYVCIYKHSGLENYAPGIREGSTHTFVSPNNSLCMYSGEHLRCYVYTGTTTDKIM